MPTLIGLVVMFIGGTLLYWALHQSLPWTTSSAPPVQQPVGGGGNRNL